MAKGYGAHVTTITGVASTSGGGIAAIANPEGADLIVTRVVLDRTTKSTGAAAVNIGIAANATTSSDNLIDGVAAGAAAAVEDNVTDGGTNGKARQKWSSSQYLTVTGEASTAGLVGKLYVEYVRVAS